MDLLPQSVMCVCVWGDNTRDLGAQTLHTQPCHVCRWARLSQRLSQHWLFFFKSMFSRSSCSAFRTHNSSSLLILSHSGSCVQQLRQKFNADSLFTCILHSLSCTQTGNTLSNCLLRSVDSEMQEEVQMKLFFLFYTAWEGGRALEGSAHTRGKALPEAAEELVLLFWKSS